MRFGLVMGFIDHLQIVTKVPLMNTSQLTTARTKSYQFIFTSRFLVTNPDNAHCLRPYWLANASQLTKLKVRISLRLAVYRQSAHHAAKPLET
jgi:hypothetical protein